MRDGTFEGKGPVALVNRLLFALLSFARGAKENACGNEGDSAHDEDFSKQGVCCSRIAR